MGLVPVLSLSWANPRLVPASYLKDRYETSPFDLAPDRRGACPNKMMDEMFINLWNIMDFLSLSAFQKYQLIYSYFPSIYWFQRWLANGNVAAWNHTKIQKWAKYIICNHKIFPAADRPFLPGRRMSPNAGGLTAAIHSWACFPEVSDLFADSTVGGVVFHSAKVKK